MIPNKAKNIYLLPVTDGGVTQPFNMPGFAGYNANKATHNGLDIGWCVNQYCDILACQDGVVVDVMKNNSSVGNAIVLQHNYEDGTHSFTGYIHLKSAVTAYKKGDAVKMGDVIGTRGGSPYVNGRQKYGTHLHLYMTKPVKTAYSWNVMKANVIDPYPLLYLSRKVKYNHINSTFNKKPYIEDVLPEVVAPVERDEFANQLTDSASNLRVRMSPSLKGTIIGFLQPNVFYNFFDVVSADGYTWRQIADKQWCAQTGTMTVYPAKDTTEVMQARIDELTAELEKATARVSKLEERNNVLLDRIAQIRQIVMSD